MQGAFLLDVVIGKGSSIFQLLSSKDQPLLVWGNSFLILDLGLDILDGVRWLNLQGAFLLDIVVGKSSSIFQLLSSKDQSLLVWGNSFLVLDLGLDVFNGIRRFNLKGDGLSSQGLDKDLHTSSQSENQMKGAFLLNVVIGESSSILELLSSKDQPLLIWWNSFLVLDLGFDILDGIRWFNLKGDGLTSQGLDEDLHTSSQSENKMESAFLLNVVIRKSPSVLQLLSSKDQSLLIWGNSFLVLDLGLDILNGIRW